MRFACFNSLMAIILLLVFSSMAAAPVGAEDANGGQPTRFGMAITGGKAFDPESIYYGLVTGFALFDYEQIWRHRAPEPLRFKVEVSAGTTVHPKTKPMASANMLALYYLRSLETPIFKPYVEGGIGVIYTDFKVEGQGLRFNFNPQIGIGTDLKFDSKREFFIASRLHHVSNGGLHHDNRGINSVIVMFGLYF